MRPIVVTGIGTDVGKTLASAVIVEALQADYWKPVQTGERDLLQVRSLVTNKLSFFHNEAYCLKAPISPHEAARRENRLITPLLPPQTENLLIIEGCGGVMTPFTSKSLLIDQFSSWKPLWIIVSKHYLGSINHTLLTLSLLQSRRQDILGIIFNGPPNSASEEPILQYSSNPCLGRLFPEKTLNKDIIQCYAKKWKSCLIKMLSTYGILLPTLKKKSLPSSLLREKELSSTLMMRKNTSMASHLGG